MRNGLVGEKMEKEFTIKNRKIGPNHKPLVIGDIGINHEGNLKTAFKIIDAAAACGIEVIKHQTHIINDEMIPKAKNVIPSNASESIYEIMKRCVLSEEEEIKLKDYVESKGIIFLSTPFSRAAADRLEKMGVLAYKIGSGECNNYPLIEHIASFGKPIILSTGMNDIKSVKKAVKILEKHKVEYALLHCTNIYPTPSHLVRLGAMIQMQKEFPNAIIGLSDHTTSNYACFAATAFGACILERHFTDRKDRPGPDIINSMNPVELKDLLIGSEEIFKMRGGKKEATKEEKPTIDFAYACVVSIENIKKGEKFTKNNLWVKRPGTGEIKAMDYEKILGKIATRDIIKNQQIKWEDVK